MDIPQILSGYDTSKLTIAALGSHSALDICSGAKTCGFRTLVIAQKGREQTYERYYRTKEGLGCIDEALVLDRFKDVLRADIQKELRRRNAIFVPHRSFEVYLDDYDAIENVFNVPMFGNRGLLKVEERGGSPNQYDLLREAHIRTPRIFPDPRDIDRPVMVKVLEKARGFERSFFIAASYETYRKKASELLAKEIITDKALKNAVIEEFVLGAQVNLNYFYSPIFGRLEFLGSDMRRQTNIEGLLRLPAPFQKEVLALARLTFEEAGHTAVTLLESMLEEVFAMGERFVKASQRFLPPGTIGPFALQTFIVPGPLKKEFVVFDVSPRMPGSPGIRFTPYGEYLWNEPMPVGKRIGVEIQEAASRGALSLVLT